MNQSAEFRLCVLQPEASLLIFDDRVESRHGDVVDSEVGIVPAADFELGLLRVDLDHVDGARRIFL